MIYTRISQDREGGGLATQRQEADCRELAARLKLRVVQVYEDRDISASDRRKQRPAYQALLHAVREGTVRTVLVWHTDRLHRQPLELEAWIAAAEVHSAVVHTVQAGALDLRTPSGRMVARMLGAAARYEVEHKVSRQRAASAQAALAGRRSGGGTRPYGYDREPFLTPEGRKRSVYTIREDEAAVIRACADRILAGEALRTVVRDLNDRGIPSVTGKPWHVQSLKRIMVNGSTSGQREHQPRSREETKRSIAGPIVAQGDWPAILTPAQTERLRAILTDPARRLTSPSPRRYLLSGGFLRCHDCEKSLAGRPKEDGTPRYVCNRVPGSDHCGRTYILADPVDAYLTEMLFIAVDGPLLDDALAARGRDTPDGDALEDEIAGIRQKMIDLGVDYDDDRITRAEYLQRRGRLEQRLADAEAQRTAADVTARLVALRAEGPLRERWGRMNLSQRRAAFAAVLDHVVVGPGRRGYNRFDATRLSDPIWRL